jgi:hypothetical protein
MLLVNKHHVAHSSGYIVIGMKLFLSTRQFNQMVTFVITIGMRGVIAMGKAFTLICQAMSD